MPINSIIKYQDTKINIIWIYQYKKFVNNEHILTKIVTMHILNHFYQLKLK